MEKKFITVNVEKCQCLPPECNGCVAYTYCNPHTPRMGMLVNVYTDSTDATNGGISSQHKQLILVGAGVPEIFEAEPDGSNCVELVERFMFGKECNIVVPLNRPTKLNGPMFGGNFIYTSDSRFPHDKPLPIHDRFESW